MTDTPLSRLSVGREKSLSEIDMKFLSESEVCQESHWPKPPPSLRAKLTRRGSAWPKVLAEIKKKSPSQGQISEVDPLELCHTYVEAGFDAISVLVDQVNFGGHPRDLSLCSKEYPNIPFLFKDLVSTPYQVYLARSVGASAILLMTQLLSQDLLSELRGLAKSIGLECMIEVHEKDELHFALSQSADIIGINSRDFKTKGLPIDLNTASRLIADLSPEDLNHHVIVAQSGINTLEDLKNIDQSCAGTKPDAVQIGTRLSQEGACPTWLKEILTD